MVFSVKNGRIENYMLLTFDIRMNIIVLEFDRKNSVIVVFLECNLICLV